MHIARAAVAWPAERLEFVGANPRFAGGASERLDVVEGEVGA
jgi:hypothetical protein